MDASQIMPFLEQLRTGLATTQDKISFLSGTNVSLAELNNAIKAIGELLDIPPDLEPAKSRPRKRIKDSRKSK